MKKILFKFFAVLMVSLIACSFTLTAFADGNIADETIPNYDDLVQPCYDNLSSATTSFSVVNGVAYVAVTYYAYSDTFSYAKLTVEIQKQFLGLFWYTVDIGTSNNKWTSTCYDIEGVFQPAINVGSGGTYRALLKLEVFGKDGTVDVVERTIKSSNST